MSLFWILAALTFLYFAYSAVMDIRERKVYSLPCYLLYAGWTVLTLFSAENYAWFMTCLFTNIAVFGLMILIKPWGEGDSELFLMFTAVLSANIKAVGTRFFIAELLCIAAVMILALVTGFVESRVKKQKLNKRSSIAIAPGFLGMYIPVIVSGILWRI